MWSHSEPGASRSSIGHDERRVGDDPQLAADVAARLVNTRTLSRVLAFAAMLLRTSRLALAHTRCGAARADLVEELPDLEVLVPGVEGPHPRPNAHRSRYALTRRHHDVPPIGRREPAITSGDLEARGEPLDIPLPRTGKRLVEVVDVEHHLALGGAEQTEVRQVSVAAELHRDPRPRGGRQIGRHDQRGAPVERERRHQHPPVPDRDKFGDAGRGLLLEQLDGVGAVRPRLQSACAGSRSRRPGLLATRSALLDGQALSPPGRPESRLPRPP